MKIATFNINNINKGLAISSVGCGTAKPVVCLQELKGFGVSADGALEKAGYGVAWRGQKSWNGVAILARDRSAVPSA
jgi:exodeoxyribonuclease-3